MKDELLKGELLEQTEDGIMINLYFTKAFIPQSSLFSPSV